MPICDSLKLIFLHVPKTGGSSIEAVLPRLRLLARYTANLPAPQHYTYRQLVKYFPREMAQYRKFAVVRNPWQRLVSDYVWQQMFTKRRLSFLAFVKKIDRISKRCRRWPEQLPPEGVWRPFAVAHFFPQHAYIGPDVRVLRHETLNKDFVSLCQEWEIPEKPLPHLNKTVHGNYEDYYKGQEGAEIIPIVLRHFGKDMELFGYPRSPFSAVESKAGDTRFWR